MDNSRMHVDRRSKAYELGVEGFLNFAVENLGNTTHIRCDIGFDPYEFANVIGDEDQPLYPGCRISYEKIHAFSNDCILYRKDYEDSTNCPTCGISRCKEGKDLILKEGVPANIFL
ncbi:hypothetical protein L3X38_033048 [Prunus dulcis]|uniref:Uncharacterized protein n=1 Tax=Prunus dulcis TaxID=3755 RepID=A0AAD4VF84_PRUDU|nr:hypothetical protein L3X38_033048 [Prunus dulcis]